MTLFISLSAKMKTNISLDKDTSCSVFAEKLKMNEMDTLIVVSGLQIRVRNWKLFSYFSTKTYVVGTQNNHLNETVLWAPKTHI